jgi:hypothetical protein
MLPASGVVCTDHRPSVLRQERLMLAIRQDAKDTIRSGSSGSSCWESLGNAVTIPRLALAPKATRQQEDADSVTR